MKELSPPICHLQQGSMRKPGKRGCFWNSSLVDFGNKTYFPIQKKKTSQISFMWVVCVSKGYKLALNKLGLLFHIWTWITYFSLQFSGQLCFSVVPKFREFAKYYEIIEFISYSIKGFRVRKANLASQLWHWSGLGWWLLDWSHMAPVSAEYSNCF
jgi:hypothetical protein